MVDDKTNVLQYIPQRQPMVMVDELVSHDNQSTISKLHLTEHNLFCENGYFSEAGLIENIAQTAALREGYESSLKGRKPAVGFIGAVKKFKLHHLPKDNATLKTEVTIEAELMNALIVSGKIYSTGTLVAEGELSIFTTETDN